MQVLYEYYVVFMLTPVCFAFRTEQHVYSKIYMKCEMKTGDIKDMDTLLYQKRS